MKFFVSKIHWSWFYCVLKTLHSNNNKLIIIRLKRIQSNYNHVKEQKSIWSTNYNLIYFSNKNCRLKRIEMVNNLYKISKLFLSCFMHEYMFLFSKTNFSHSTVPHCGELLQSKHSYVYKKIENVNKTNDIFSLEFSVFFFFVESKLSYSEEMFLQSRRFVKIWTDEINIPSRDSRLSSSKVVQNILLLCRRKYEHWLIGVWRALICRLKW